MTQQQKRILVALGALAGVVLVALIVALLVRDDSDENITADDTTTTTVVEETTTTVDLRSSTTSAPTTTTTTAKPSSASTTTTAPKPVIDGRGAVLTASSSPRREMTGNDCASLAEAGWTAECGTFTGKGGVEMAWLVEQRAPAFRVYVLRRVQGKQWNVVLEARDDDGSRFADVNVRVVDVSGDNAAEAVFGFRGLGTTAVLSVDVVEGPGKVVVHRDSRQGSARLSPGQVDLWEAAGAQYDHLTIRFTDNAWRIVANVKVPPADVPPSQL